MLENVVPFPEDVSIGSDFGLLWHRRWIFIITFRGFPSSKDFFFMLRYYIGLIDNFTKLRDDKSYGTVTNIFIRIRRKKNPHFARYRALDIDDTREPSFSPIHFTYVLLMEFLLSFFFFLSRLGQPVLILSEIGWNFLIFRVRWDIRDFAKMLPALSVALHIYDVFSFHRESQDKRNAWNT